MPPLAVPSSLVSTTPVTSTASLNSSRLAQAVLPGGRVEDEQRLVRGAGQLLLDHPAHLLELAHQVDLGVQAPGGVDDDDVGAARARRGDAVVDDGGRVAARVLLDDLAADAVGPLG